MLGITDPVYMNLSKLWEILKEGGAWHGAVHWVAKFRLTDRLKKNNNDKLSANIPNGEKLKAFPLRSGKRKECSFLPILFNIVLEIPVMAIRKKKEKKKRKCKKAKWLSEEASQTAEERRKGKTKGKKERYSNLNAKF